MKRLVLLTFAVSIAISTATAQQSFFRVEIENLSPTFSFQSGGVFNTPVGATDPAAIGPGQAYEFTVDALPGAHLSFATMFVHSNDLFFAPGPNGIALWDDQGMPVGGDVTDQVLLWDAGTEVNQEPGVGADQAPRQSGADTGDADTDNTVREVSDGFAYPVVADVIQVSLTVAGENRFTVRIENVSMDGTLQPSDGSMLAVPMAPGVWVVHTEAAPLFDSGTADPGDGLEALAEDGNPAGLGEIVGQKAGVNQIIAPGVWAVHTDAAPLFADGEADRDQGLEDIAEDGNPGLLAQALSLEPVVTGGAFLVPDGADGPGPVAAGEAYAFTVAAMPGARLSFATMLVQTNDLFFAPDESGITLWDNQDVPVSGDVTDQIMLWDAGTEVNEIPGFGPNQAPRQAGADTGDNENGVVHLVDDGFTYPATEQVIRVTITPLPTTPFTVRIENVSTETTLTPLDGSMLSIPMAPGVWVVHADASPLFEPSASDRGYGLESLAEDGNPAMLGGALAQKLGYGSAVFDTPAGGAAPGPIGPGQAYEFIVDAAPGAHLSFATMFVHSNDLFFSPDDTGIALWDDQGIPVSGDVTDQVRLWDAGTEVNQEPGVGADQAPRQSGPDTGEADTDDTVRSVDDAFTYPAVAEVVRVSITGTPTATEPGADVPSRFTLHQNYPNPFNPETTIAFDLQDAGAIRLSVYSVIGQKVVDLVDGYRAAGVYEVRWDGRDQQGGRVATGVYLYQLDVGASRTVRKMVLLQ